MKTILKTALLAVLFLFANSQVLAEDRGTANDAIAMVKKAVAQLKQNGREKTFAEINKSDGQFHDRDLYIIVYDIKGTKIAHGANQKMMGKNNLELKDADGKYMIKDFIDVATSKGQGWVDYKWPNPTTKAIESKSTYVEKFEDIVIGCGIYKGVK